MLLPKVTNTTETVAIWEWSFKRQSREIAIDEKRNVQFAVPSLTYCTYAYDNTYLSSVICLISLSIPKTPIG